MKVQILMILAALGTASVHAEEGSGAHGGHPVALSFVAKAQEVADWIRRMDPTLLGGLTAEQIEGLMTPDLILDPTDESSFQVSGRTVCFSNESQPVRRIRLSIPCWMGISADAQLVITFHELLGLLAMEQDHYAVSSQFYREVLRLRGEARDQRWACNVKCGVHNFGGQITVIDLIDEVRGRSASAAYQAAETVCRVHRHILHPGEPGFDMGLYSDVSVGSSGSWIGTPASVFDCYDRQGAGGVQ